MPTPVYSAGAPGNLINGASVAKGATVAALLDLSSAFEGQVTCEMATGGTAPSAATTFSAYKVYGNASANTLTAAAAAGATSITVSSVAGLHSGQRILLQQASGAKAGEIVTVASINGTAVALGAATINAYSGGDGAYLVSQNAVLSIQPSSTTGGWVANTDYSGVLFLGPGQWAIAANNTDSTQTVTVSVSVDKITAYQ